MPIKTLFPDFPAGGGNCALSPLRGDHAKSGFSVRRCRRHGQRSIDPTVISFPQVKSAMSATDKKRVPDRSKRPRSRNNALKKRRTALKKKASELVTLCDVKLCLVSYPPQGGEPEFWPENKSEVEDILTRFQQLSEADRAKKRFNPSNFLRNKKRVLEEDPGPSTCPDYHTWCPQLEECSENKLWELIDDLDVKLQMLNKQIDRLAGKRSIDDTEMVNLFSSSNGGCHCNQEGSMVALVPNSHAANTDQIQQSAIPLRQLPYRSSTCLDEDAIDCSLQLGLRLLPYRSSTCLDEDAIDCNLQLGPSAD